MGGVLLAPAVVIVQKLGRSRPWPHWWWPPHYLQPINFVTNLHLHFKLKIVKFGCLKIELLGPIGDDPDLIFYNLSGETEFGSALKRPWTCQITSFHQQYLAKQTEGVRMFYKFMGRTPHICHNCHKWCQCKQAHKARRCDSYLQIWTITHSPTDRGRRCFRI